MEEDGFYSLLYILISSFFVIFLIKFVVLDLWWVPTRIEKHFMKQGIKSPKYEFFLGNLREISSFILKVSAQAMPLSHDILPRVLSFFHVWNRIYGTYSFLFLPFFFSFFLILLKYFNGFSVLVALFSTCENGIQESYTKSNTYFRYLLKCI